MEETSMYLELLKKVLIDYPRLGMDEYKPLYMFPKFVVKQVEAFKKIKNKKFKLDTLVLCEIVKTTEEKRLNGEDWPLYADTMIGMKRLNNIQFCVQEVIKNNIEGDLVELGVWRGGATILMKAILKEKNITNKIIWAADSFEGLPVPDAEKYPEDKHDRHFRFKELAVSLEQVKYNFQKYGLLDDNIRFLKGWFKDTLPTAPIEKISLLRLDGDMYESTMDGLVNLYHKLSKGGYLIVDDWGSVKGCKQAIEDFRQQHGITEEIKPIDRVAVYWKKEK